MTQSIANKPRLHEIDLLRFLAALAVVLFHYTFRGEAADDMTTFSIPSFSPVTKYGFLGVHLFFIISGFVILMTAQHGSLRRFVISRITRLYPAFWCCCTLTAAVIWLAADTRYIVAFNQWLINLTMLNSFIYVPSVDGVYWSLCIELKFYLLMLVLLFFGQVGEIEKYLWFWLFAAVLLWLRPLPYLYALLIPEYAPYFVAGSTFYLIFRDGWSASKLLLIAYSFSASLLMVHDDWMHMQAHFDEASFDFIIIAGAIACFFLIFLLIASGLLQRFSYSGFVYLGVLTYPLYLVHQNIGFILFNRFAGGGQSPLLLLLEVLVLMLAVAFVVHRSVECRYSKPLGNVLENLFAKAATLRIRGKKL